MVVLTRGHRQDYDAIRALAGRDLRYIGLIGSRAKVAKVVERAREEGVPADWLRAVRAPVGLDIGAVTPEEIAVSILAELVAVRRGKIAAPDIAAHVDAMDRAGHPALSSPADPATGGGRICRVWSRIRTVATQPEPTRTINEIGRCFSFW